jgi:hypothetical protein
MSRTAEIVIKVQSVGAAVDDAKSAGGQALERATELTEQASAHGWTGVATSMQGAQDALEEVLASLGSAEGAVTESLGALGAITEQMSSPEVADHLGQALNHLDQARTGANAASSSLDDARTAAEQAGSPESLMGILQTVNDEIDSAWRGMDAAKSSIESEQQNAGTWGN